MLFLGGSYATGNYTENSDIDISIITKNNYKKRGNVIIDDIMIEYFINPISELKNIWKTIIIIDIDYPRQI